MAEGVKRSEKKKNNGQICSAVVSGTMPLVQTQNNCVGGASVLSLRYYLSLSA